MSTEPDAVPAEPRSPRSLALWVLGMAGAGVVICVAYLLGASPLFPSCDPLGGYHGGQAAAGSLESAVVVGIALWVVASISSYWLRRWLPLLAVGFGLAYVGGLIVLWSVSPEIWGPRVCS